MTTVPFYHDKECYLMYIRARESDIKSCTEAIKIAKKRIKDKEYYPNGLR